jgi:molybdate transport system substrate-binding protein
MVRIVCIFLTLLCETAHAQRIAAASDVQPALDPLIAQYNAASQSNVQITYGSSGKLAAQIEAGAPFDIFLSADEIWVARLRAKWPHKPVVEYGRGRLAEISLKKGQNCAAGMDALLVHRRIAIANPDHAPYGARAKEVFVRAGVWERLQANKQIVMAESVSAALQWVTSGAASAGIVAWTQAQSLPAAQFCVHKISTTQHAPLVQQMLHVKSDPNVDPLWAYLTSKESLRAFKRAGLSDEDSMNAMSAR